ncbi:MAG: mechanosensitive ion channel [Myxococcota bacterium]
MPVPEPEPVPAPSADDPTLWLFVGPPPLDARRRPRRRAEPTPAPWRGPPLLGPPAPTAHARARRAGPRARPTRRGRRPRRAGLRRLLTVWALLGLLLVLAIAVGAYRLVARVADAARDAGYDLDRRLVGLRVAAAGAAGLWVTGLVARQLLERVPLVGLALVGAFGVGAVLVLARQAVQALGGMVLILGARVREGDRITVGDVAGTVEEAGFLRLRLRRPDGAIVFVPAQALDDGPVTVSSPRRTQPVRVRAPAPDGPQAREALRRTAVLCPYRQADSEVRIERLDGDPAHVDVVLQAWSASAAEAAEAWLRRALAD